MTQKFMTALCIFFAFSLSANADHKKRHGNTGYFSVGVSRISFDSDLGVNFDNSLIEGRFGYNINSTFAVELRAAGSVSDDNYLGVNVEIDSYVGAYVVAQLPLGKTLNLYGFAGAANVSITATGLGLSTTGNDTDASFGVGFSVKLPRNSAINLEYTDLYRKDNIDISSVSLTYKLSY